MRALLTVLLMAAAVRAAEPLKQSAGRYEVTLRLPDGGLYAREEMEIEFRIEDTSKPDPLTGFAPVIRALPEATVDMPSMPRMPKFSETAHAEGIPGDYGIHPTFAHGGEFRLRIVAHPPIGAAFEIEFPLQVMDASARKRLPARYSLVASTEPKKPKAGEPVTVRFVIFDRDTGPVTAFETVHEALMHLVIVRRDLTRFAHEHPRIEADGSFRLSYTFPTGGDYRLFADVAPKNAGGQILLVKLSVSGAQSGIEAPPQTGPTRVEPPSTLDVLPVHKSTIVAFVLRDATTGQPVGDLEPFLGAAGHLMLVHEDAETFVHSHPDDGVSDGTLRFLARFPKAGNYRGWMQFRRQGQVWTTTVTLRAGDGK